MTVIPSLPYERVIRALECDGWIVVRQKGSHIRLQKQLSYGTTLNLTVPAHRPIKRSTLAKLLKQAQIDVDDFKALL